MPSVFTDVRTKLSRILLVFQCPVLGRLFRRGSAGSDGGYILGDSGARDQGMYSCGWSGTRGELRGLWIRYSARIDHAITQVRNSLRIFQLAIEAIRRVTQPNRATDKQSALDDQRIDGTSRSGQQGEVPPWLQGEVGLDMANSGLGQGHWNIAGHHLAGQLIAQELCRTLKGSQPAQIAGHSSVSRASYRTR